MDRTWIGQAVPVGDGWTLAIDFGTTATTVAVADEQGARMIDIDDAGSLPSTVAWVGGRLVVGAEAERHRIFDPGAAAVHPKRLLGRRRTLLLGTEAVPTVDAVGAVLATAADAAIAQRHGRRPSTVVLTHPVRWSEAQVDALIEAARLAHLVEPVTVPEPVAAARHYGIDRLDDGQHLAVYDLGGGTFDTVVLTRVGDDLDVTGPPGGDESTGGDDFDSRLMTLVVELVDARSTEWADRLRHSDELEWRRAAAALLLESRRAKETLSRQTTCTIALPAPMAGEVRVTRPELEELLRGDLVATVDELVATVERAGLTTDDLATTYVIGGASRSPLVTRLLHEALGVPPTTLDDPKAVVALGATTLPTPTRPSASALPAQPELPPDALPPPPTLATPEPAPGSGDGASDSDERSGPPWPWIAAGIALLAVIGLVAAVVVTRSDSGTRDATVAVGGNPTGLAFADGRTWAVVDDTSDLVAIDPATNGVTARLDVGDNPLGLVSADGSIWVADEEANAVVRVDPDDRTVLAMIPVGRRPLAVAAGNGAIWVANYDDATVSRVDPGTDAVVATIPVGRGPSAVAVGEGAVWVANGDDATVSKVDPDDDTSRLTLPVGGQPLAIAAGGGSVWVASFSDATVTRIDPDRDEVAGSIAVGKGPAALALDGSDLWVANSQDDSVMRIDTSQGRVAGTRGSGRGPAALTIGAGSLWVANGLDATVSRMGLR